MPGHPDWQAYASRRGSPFVNSSSLVLGTADSNLGTFQLASFDYVLIVGSVAGNVGIITVTFTDPTGLVASLPVQMVMRAGQSFSYVIPIALDQMSVKVRRVAGAAATLKLYVAPTNIPYQLPMISTSVLVNASVAGVAQNAAATADLPAYVGLIRVAVESSQQNFNARVICKDTDDTTILAKTMEQTSGATGSQVDDTIYVPALLNTISVTNLNAAAATISMWAVAQRWAGP